MRFMQEQGMEVHGISAPGRELEEVARSERIEVHAVPMERRITPFRDLISLWRLYWKIRAIRPHIVHTHTPKGGVLGILAAWLARVPVRIHTVHGLPLMTARGVKRKLLRWSEKLSCLCAHQVFAVSRSLAAVAVQEKLCATDKIKVILNGSSNGVDTAGQFNPQRYGEKYRSIIRHKYKIPCNAVVVGFVGRIVQDKGMAELAEAWRNLREEFPSLHLLLVGPFEPQDPIPQEIETLFHDDPRIHIVGHVDESSSFYSAMDILVLPTYREGLPGVLLEAAAMTVPVVATRIPGCISAVAEGVNGLLVRPRDAGALTDALRTYITSPSLRRQHGQAGRKFVMMNFQSKLIWESLYREYARLLKEKGQPVPDGNRFAHLIPTKVRRAA